MIAANTQPSRTLSLYFGWIASILGAAVWTYGLFVTGTPSMVAWGNHLPHWASEWLPNLESELGMTLAVIGSIPLYWDMWRQRRDDVP